MGQERRGVVRLHALCAVFQRLLHIAFILGLHARFIEAALQTLGIGGGGKMSMGRDATRWSSALRY